MSYYFKIYFEKENMFRMVQQGSQYSDHLADLKRSISDVVANPSYSYQLFWKDSKGDLMLILTSSDLNVAFQLARESSGKIIPMHVKAIAKPEDPIPKKASANTAFQVKLYVQPGDEIRYFVLNHSTTFKGLEDRVRQLVGRDVRLYWKDKEGDLVFVGSEDEFSSLKTNSASNSLLRVYAKPVLPAADTDEEQDDTEADEEADTEADEEQEKPVHPLVVCDGCHGSIVGTRYKCFTCPCFDLCEACESHELHPEHDMLAIRDPKSSNWKVAYAAYQKPNVGKIENTSAVISNEHHQPLQGQGKAEGENGRVVSVELKLNQSLESLLKDFNGQVKEVPHGIISSPLPTNVIRVAAQQPNDAVKIINLYMVLIMERSKKSRELPKVYAFHTSFYPKVRDYGQPSVGGWTRNVNIFTYDMLIVPMHVGNHWCLAVVDFSQLHMTYYDSLGGRNTQVFPVLRDYLEQELKDKKHHFTLDWKQWRFVMAEDIPQLKNGSDCALITCLFADYLSRREVLTFSQEQMPYSRPRRIGETGCF